MQGTFGREAELAAITAARNDPAVPGVVIEGPAGIGKSTLLTAALATAAANGAATSLGAASELTGRLPFGPLADALGLRPDADHPARAAAGALLRGRDDVTLDPGQLRWQVIEAILDDVEHRTARAPLVLAIEDLQWADEDTLLAMQRLAAAAAQLDLTLLMTTRPAPRPAMVDSTVHTLWGAGLRGIKLAGLSDDALSDLAAARFGREVDDELRRRLASAGGNPLLITELLDAETREGAHIRSLTSAITYRLADLDPAVVRALDYAAVLGERFHIGDLAEVLGREATDTIELLRPALENGVIRDEDDRLAFRHALVRDHLYDRLGTATQSAIHRHAADALRLAGARAEQVGAHLLHATLDDAAAKQLIELAAEVVDRAPDAAAAWATRAAEHLRGGAVAVRARTIQARALALGTHPDQAVDIARPLLHSAIDPGTRVDLAATVALAQLFLGTYDAAIIDGLVGSLEAIGDPRGRWAQLVVAAIGLDALDRTGEAVALAERIIDHPDADTGARAVALALRGRSRVGSDPSRAHQDLGAAFALTTETGILHEWTGAQALALCQRSMLPFRRFSDVLRRGLVATERSGYPATTLTLQAMLAHSLVWQGEWNEAEVHAQAVLAATGNRTPREALEAWDALAMIAARRGDIEALQRAPDPDVVDPPALWRRTMGCHEARALAASGEREEAWHLAERTRAAWEDYGAPWAYTLGMPYVTLALELGHDERARSFHALTDAASQAIGRGVGLVEAIALGMRALLDEDLEAARAAVELARRSPVYPIRVDALMAAGSVLARCGEQDEAVEVLEEARGYAATAEATLDIGQIDAVLRDIGVRTYRSRPRSTTGWEALSEAEQRIVPLVADGLTYREIGERLFVSRRTVETHISNIFRKVGARSRHDLARTYLDSEEAETA